MTPTPSLASLIIFGLPTCAFLQRYLCKIIGHSSSNGNPFSPQCAIRLSRFGASAFAVTSGNATGAPSRSEKRPGTEI
jgi:hypothetical protein